MSAIGGFETISARTRILSAGPILNPDVSRLHRLLSEDIGLHIYSMGDLDPFFAPFTTWFGWTEGTAQDELTAVAVIYAPDRSATPTLLALSPRPARMRRLRESTYIRRSIGWWRWGISPLIPTTGAADTDAGSPQRFATCSERTDFPST